MPAYRELSLKGLRPVQVDRTGQAVPRLDWVPLAQLVIDPAYQRDVQSKGRRSIQQIAEHFDWSKFACIVVASIEGGGYAIIDGQHRATAAMLVGLESVPAQIMIIDQRTQAAAFTAINAVVTRMTPVQVHKAAVAARDATALEIEEVCACADVTIPRSQSGWNMKQVGHCVAVHAVRENLRLYGRNTVITALQCVTQTTNNQPGMLRSFVIAGLCRLLAQSPLWRDAGDALFRAMDDISLDEIVHNAKTQASRSSDGSAVNDFIFNLDKELRRRLGPPAPAERVGNVVELNDAAGAPA